MSIFTKPFFSAAGQKERISNVGKTLKAAVTGSGVQSNTSNQTGNKLLSAAASNPFVTALPIAVARAPAAALAASKAVYGSLSPGAKVAGVIAAPVVIGAVVSNPSLVSKASKAPKELSEFGSDLGSFLNDPSVQGAKDLFSNSPIITGGLALAGVAAVGGALAAPITTALNTRAIRENTEQQLMPIQTGSTVPLTPETQIIGREVTSTTPKRARKPRKTSSTPSVRVNVLNQQTYISR